MEKIKIWYPRGSGGMWVNYLIYCNNQQTTIPGNHTSFEFLYLHSLCPSYFSNLDWALHNSDPAESLICLGDNHSWYNFYLNSNVKKETAKKEGLAEGALNAVKNQQKHIKFNLNWTLIWTDPGQFIQELNQLGSFNITLNQYTEQAFKQYRNSCFFPKLDSDEFQKSDLFKYWHQSLVDHETDPNLTMAQRDNQAVEITKNMFFTGCKK